MTIKSQSNNARIAKNTCMLYIRMFFIMAISLYTSRVVLNTLGVEDFGIYNVVGGIVAMFGFINSSMTSATQRYITYALGKNDMDRLKVVFGTALQIHLLIAVMIIVTCEVVGLLFLYNKLQIPPERMNAAFWVLQCSIVAAVIMIVSVPYNALIIAHEHMSAFAYISIVEAVLRLTIVYVLLIFSVDKLILYAVLLLGVQLLVRLCYTHYCHNHFIESKYSRGWNSKLFKEMTTFAGWSFFGNLAFVLYTQGLNMLLNIFFGPVVNAARGIAVQVQGAVQSFAGNFQMAINPQITKNYASGNLSQMHNLMFRSARFSFYLLMYMTLPIILEVHFVLVIWLKTVPDYTVVFVRLMLLITLLNPLASPCTIASQATGDVKRFQLIVGGILLLVLPISYIALKLGAPAYAVFIVHFMIEVVAVLARMFVLRDMIDLPVKGYFREVYLPIIFVSLASGVIPLLEHNYMDEGWLRFIVVGLTSAITLSLFIYVLGLRGGEKAMVMERVKQLIKK